MNNNLHQAQSHDVLRSWQSQRNDVNHHKDFVLPMFIGNDDNACEKIDSMPEVYRYGGVKAIEYLEPLVYNYGLRAILLFPVVTKSDQANVELLANEDDDDDNNQIISPNSSRSISSSHTLSLLSSSSSSSSSATSSDEADDIHERRVSSAVMPEPLLPNEEESSATQQQNNPFLNQMNEEADHLLADQQITVGSNQESNVPPPFSSPAAAAMTNSSNMIPPKMHSNVPPPPPPPPRVKADNLRKKMRSLDVKLIKGMALKEKYNPVLRLIPRLRAKFPDLLIICDVCLCAFTSTGHCCLFDDSHHQQQDKVGANNNHHILQSSSTNFMNQYPISNKITCQYLAMLSVEYALRGCNVVAPSDMMDGRILVIREKLNENRLQHVSILSYSAKFASIFYGPFRSATNNAPEFGDRRTYQLPPGSRAMALKAVQRDIDQGADFVMVKPGGAYLDIVRDIRESHRDIPIAVYQVSGEYAMLKLAAKSNILDLKHAVNETLTSFRRAGATIIITYFTPELLRGEL